jgi:hypothetical protein
MAKMNWPFRTRQDILRICLAVLVVGIAVLVFLVVLPRKLPNGGFGPEWQCTTMPNGEPAVCVKKPRFSVRWQRP